MTHSGPTSLCAPRLPREDAKGTTSGRPLGKAASRQRGRAGCQRCRRPPFTHLWRIPRPLPLAWDPWARHAL